MLKTLKRITYGPSAKALSSLLLLFAINGYALGSAQVNPGVGVTDTTIAKPTQDTLKKNHPVQPLKETGRQEASAPQKQTLNQFLKKGKFSGQVRNLFMYTDNTGDLPDYHSLALGAGLGYESPKYKGFNVAASGFFIFNAASSNLGTDPETGFRSRYEIGNFDLLAPDDKHDLGRMETLYLRYTSEAWVATLGRQKIFTPFINPQDGRMRPTLVNGLWLEQDQTKKLSFKGGFLWGMGPRSTADWFSVEESIGSIPAARNVYGKPSQYVGNIESKGIILANATYKPTKNVQSALWHYYVDNLFNLAFSQTDVSIPVNQDKSRSVLLGFQAGYQGATGDGGNADTLKAYMPKDAETWFYSGRLGFKTKKVETSLNYTQIADQDRFLFPREWGIEPFYTFLPRERFEGGADSRGIVLKTELKPHPQWKGSIGYGLFDTPSVRNARQNKYAMPSYSQLNLLAKYSFKGHLDGLVLQTLYVYKGARGETFEDARFIENKVNMSHVTFVMNYQF